MDPAEVRARVADGSRVLAVTGLGDAVWGHLSAKDPRDRGIWIKSAGLGFEETTPDDVILVDWEGRCLEGDGAVPKEYPIHTEIYRARPDVGAVVHAHPTHGLALMASGQPLRPISHDACWLVPPEVPTFSDTADLVTTPTLGARVATVLGIARAVFLRHHGIATAGEDVTEAVMTAVLLERSCRLQLLAARAGGPVSWSSDEEALTKREHCWPRSQLEAGFRYWLRRASRQPAP